MGALYSFHSLSLSLFHWNFLFFICRPHAKQSLSHFVLVFAAFHFRNRSANKYLHVRSFYVASAFCPYCLRLTSISWMHQPAVAAVEWMYALTNFRWQKKEIIRINCIKMKSAHVVALHFLNVVGPLGRVIFSPSQHFAKQIPLQLVYEFNANNRNEKQDRRMLNCPALCTEDGPANKRRERRN